MKFFDAFYKQHFDIYHFLKIGSCFGIEISLFKRKSEVTNRTYHGLKLVLTTSRPRPRVAVALPGDCLAVNVRLNDIVTFLDVTKLR
jgi:hypothetical protein